MARKNRQESSSRGLYGLLAGLIIGVAAASAVVLFVTKVPMPFADKASRAPAQTLLPDVHDAPDPNIGLYGKDAPAGATPAGPTDTTLPPPVGTPPATAKHTPSLPDSVGDLIANLSKADKAGEAKPAHGARPIPGTGVATPHTKPAPGTSVAIAQPKPAPPTPIAPRAAGTQKTYYLQAGAFRSESDAEATKARIILLGLSAEVQKAQINGATINRVRVGPFKGIDEMNKSRVRLGEEKIDSSVMRQ
jgi:cell division protein FtsN